MPDPLAPFEEKKSNEYGLSIAKLISSDWFGGGFVLQERLFLTVESTLERKGFCPWRTRCGIFQEPAFKRRQRP